MGEESTGRGPPAQSRPQAFAVLGPQLLIFVNQPQLKPNLKNKRKIKILEDDVERRSLSRFEGPNRS